MTVYEFVNLLSDDSETIAVWDFSKEKEVFNGSAQEAAWEFGDYEVLSIDLVPKFEKVEEIVILNIETEDDE